MRLFLFVSLIALAAPAWSAPPAPLRPVPLRPGTILPVSLDTTLRSDRAHPGDRIQATLMQSIPATPGESASSLRRGTRLLGQVVAVTPAPHPSLTLRFTTLRLRHRTVSVRVSLRAMASLLEVEEAETPEDMAMRGTVPENATSRQIGGQQVYRGGGPVAEGMTPVGKPVAYGILALPLTRPGQPCRAQLADNSSPQAFWRFSSDACGLFGYPGLRIQHAGRSAPSGQIVFTSTRRKFTLQSGSGLLLRILPTVPSAAQAQDSELQNSEHQDSELQNSELPAAPPSPSQNRTNPTP